MKNIVWKGSTELEVVKQNSLTAMRHHADEQIKKLKEHANLLVKQAQELDERVKLAEKIAKGEIKFKEDTEPFFSLLESYLRNHNIVYEQFKHDRPAEYDKDFLFSTTVDNLDLIDEVLDYNILTYTDLSAIDNEWYKNLNYWITDGKLKIENYNVTGIIHYGKHAFDYGELDKLARQEQI